MEPGQTEHKIPISLYRRAGNTIYVAGHGAVTSTGEFVSPDFETQMRYTMGELFKTLALAGATPEQVVMVHSYVQEPSNLPQYNKLYREYFNEPYPSRTTITGCLPPGLEFEIECIVHIEA